MNNKRITAKEIAEMLRREILLGKLLTGDVVPSVRTLSATYGVSTVTANQAIRILSEEQLIVSLRGKGSFVAENPRTHKHLCVGIIDCFSPHSTHLELPMLDAIPNAAEQYFKKHGCRVKRIAYEPIWDAKKFHDETQGLDGVIGTQVAWGTSGLQKAVRNIPVVSYLQDFVHDYPVHQVVLEHHAAMDALVEQIIRFKIPKVLILADNYPNSLCRKNALIKAINRNPRAKVEIEEYLTGRNYVFADTHLYGVVTSLLEIFPGNLVFCASDTIVWPVLQILRSTKLVPGRDFSLVSYDNSEDYGFLTSSKPIITALDSRMTDIGMTAAKLLLDRIHHKQENEIHIIRIPSRLIIGDTAFSKMNPMREPS